MGFISYSYLRLIIFFVFSLSGFTALLYEIIWSNYLKNFLGHAAYAQSIVLMVFMGGLALGSYLSSVLSKHLKDLCFFYGLIEIVIGLFAMVFHTNFVMLTDFTYNVLFQELSPFFDKSVIKVIVAASLILPQCILIGMTFPLIVNFFSRKIPASLSQDISSLYFTNSIGGFLGVLFTGFYLIPSYGYKGSLLIAGITNTIIGAVFVLFFREKKDEKPNETRTITTHNSANKSIITSLIICSFFTGFASFIYEIGWVRMLNQVLGSSTHAFELMLSSFILGLALGGLWIRLRIKSLKNPLLTLIKVQIIMGCLSLLSIFLYDYTFELMIYLYTFIKHDNQGYTLFNLGSHFICGIVMLPATFCAGLTLPLLTWIGFKVGWGERSSGIVYASNTLGCIAGVVFAVHYLLPISSSQSLIMFGSLVDVLVGIILFYKFFIKKPSTYSQFLHNKSNFSLKSLSFILIIYFASLAFLKLAYKLPLLKYVSEVYNDRAIKDKDRFKVIYLEDGKTATISYRFDNKRKIGTLATNGKADASFVFDRNNPSPDEVTQILLAYLPLSLHSNTKQASVIGFGSGITSHSLLNYKKIKKVTTIEIEEKVIEAARNFLPLNKNVYEDKKSEIIIDDARSFYSLSNKRYDLIISEPSNPWVSGVSSLFTKEFYNQIIKNLASDGIFAQWLQVYQIDKRTMSSIIQSFAKKFPSYHLFAISDYDILLIGSTRHNKTFKIDQVLFDDKVIRENLNYYGIDSVNDFYIRSIASQELINSYFSDDNVIPNSDFHPFVDYNAVKDMFFKKTMNKFNRLAYLTPLKMIDPYKINYTIDTPIGVNDFFSRSKWPRLAFEYYQAIVTNKMSINFKDGALAFLKSKDKVCIDPYKKIEYRKDILKIGKVSLAYLSNEKLKNIWQVVNDKICMDKPHLLSTMYFEFFNAFANSEHIQSIAIGKKILSNSNYNLSANDSAYFIGIMMMVAIKQKDYKTANAIYLNYFKEISDNSYIKEESSIELLYRISKKHI